MDMKNNFLVFLFLFFSVFNFAQDKKILDNIIAKYEKINIFSANIVQKNSWEELDTIVEYSGKIFYNQDNLLISYPKEEQTILVKKDTVFVLNNKNKQLIISRNTSFNLRISFLLKSFYKSLSKIEVSKKNKDCFLFFDLDNETAEKYSLTNAILEFSNNNNLKEIKFINQGVSSITYTFNDLKTNISPKSDLFYLDIFNKIEIINLFDKE